MDITKAPTFIPSQDHVSAFSQLRSLDLLPANGLAIDEFWSLFSRCQLCQNFVSTRTVPYHRCPADGQPLLFQTIIAAYYFNVASPADIGIKFDENSVKNMYFLWLLDAHERAMGIPEVVFKEIFYTCAECGRYMTQRVSFNHHDDSDDWEYSSSQRLPCIYLRSQMQLNDGALTTSK